MISPRMIFLAGLFAATTAGVIAIHHRSVVRAQASPSTPPILDRRVASVHLHGVELKDAIPRLSTAMGLAVTARWDMLAKHRVDGDEEIWLDFDDVPISRLMQAFIEQIRGYTERADFNLEHGAIIIAPDDYLQRSVRVYDVSDLEREMSSTPKPHDDLQLAMRFCMEERYWSCGVVVTSQDRWLHDDSSQLMIVQTAEGHDRIAAFLAALRHALPDGSGPGIARCRVLGRHSSNTEVRFYDVRDLGNREQYIESRSANPPWITDGLEALGCLVANQGDERRWNQPGQACGALGRLMVEQTPDMHKRVRQVIADVRAGKQFPGFRLVGNLPKE